MNIDTATYEAICRALEATQAYAAPRIANPRTYGHDAQLMRVDLMAADALELLDKEIAA